MAVAKTGRERIEHLRFVLNRMDEIQAQLATASDASERAQLNAASRDNFRAFELGVASIVTASWEDAHAWALIDLVEEDPNLDLSRLDDVFRTAPIWRKHLDAALDADEDGPVGADYEDEDE